MNDPDDPPFALRLLSQTARQAGRQAGKMDSTDRRRRAGGGGRGVAPVGGNRHAPSLPRDLLCFPARPPTHAAASVVARASQRCPIACHVIPRALRDERARRRAAAPRARRVQRRRRAREPQGQGAAQRASTPPTARGAGGQGARGGGGRAHVVCGGVIRRSRGRRAPRTTAPAAACALPRWGTLQPQRHITHPGVWEPPR